MSFRQIILIISILCILSLMYLVSSCGDGAKQASPFMIDGLSEGSNRATGSDQTEEEHLARINRTWRLYTENSDEGSNLRRRIAGFARERVFDQALTAYWKINDNFPQGETAGEVINILNENRLVPFWPLDPETGEQMRLVSNADEISSWGDVYVTMADNGAFNYTLKLFSCFDLYETEINTIESSERLGSLERVIYLPPEHGYTDPIIKSSDPSEVFGEMIISWFRIMVNEAFVASGGQVPLTLQELFANRIIVHQEGWGHPVGPRSENQVGDFECGVDPSINGYYWEINTSRDWRTLVVFKFVQTEIAGEMVYDTTRRPDGTMTELARDDELVNRIPLLSDELFAGAPPEI